MSFVNRRQRFNFSFLTLITVFLSIVSITFGTIISSAGLGDNDDSNSAAKSFSFTTEGITTSSEIIADSPVFQEFDAWVASYANNDFRASGEQISLGESLAVKREQALKELIRANPQAALGKAVPTEVYNRLPQFVTDHLEKRISANGDFFVYVIDEIDRSTRQMTGTRTEREVIIGNSRYKTFVYGRRETMTTKFNIPLQGIVVGDSLVLNENPVQKIEPTEYANRSVDKSLLVENGVAAEIGGKVAYFSNQAELDHFVREQIEWESKIGPDRPEQNLRPDEQASSWTEGPKTVLVIRVDFSDRPGEPIDVENQPLTAARAQSLFTNEVNPFYVANSYNKTSMQATVTPVVRVSQPQSFYTQGSNYNTLLTDARIAARAAGFETNNFNLDLITFTYTSGFNFAGISAIGAKGSMLNGFFYMEETSHELGHSYGLLHASLWRTNDGTPIGSGTNVEYGDCYDVMAACYGEGQILHFNARYKRLLEWLTDSNVQTVTNSGIYRVFAHDSSSPGGIRTLKIRRDATKNYWVEFRQLFTNNSNALNGALIRWDFLSGSLPKTQLLDMNPTTSTTYDAPLLIGQSFYDSVNNIRITVVGKGNTTPESLDVNVELNPGSTPTPTPTTPTPTPTPNCTYSISPASQNFASTGGSGSVTVATQSGCSWTANANQGFVTVTAGGSGSGSGTVNYSVAANSGAARIGTITVAGQTFTIQQNGTTVGSYTLVASPSIVAPGGQITVNFTAPAGSSLIDWIGLFRVGTPNTAYLDGGYTNGFTSGTLSGIAPNQAGQYEFRYLLNDGYTSVATSNTITVQAAATPTPTPSCTYSITPASQSFSQSGGTGVINITTTSGCSWAVGTNQNFVFISSSTNGSGNGTVSFVVASNATGLSRTATITIAGQVVTVNQTGTTTVPNATAYDFDGDGKADVSLFRPTNGIWYLSNSQSGFTGLQFGATTDKVVPADYDGDGKTDVAVYRAGTWYIQQSGLGFTNIQFGVAGDVPVPADYDGDGKSDLAVYRSSAGTWFLQRSTAGFTGIQFGQSSDKPMAADFDGDGKADLAVFRPSNGIWYIQQSTAGFTGVQFGDANDKLVAADYDGDGRDDVAVYRPSNGFWYLNRSTAGFTGIQFGLATDAPVPADYDGDGKTDIAVYRNDTWFIQRSTAGFTGVQFGSTGDQPVPNAFVR